VASIALRKLEMEILPVKLCAQGSISLAGPPASTGEATLTDLAVDLACMYRLCDEWGYNEGDSSNFTIAVKTDDGSMLFFLIKHGVQWQDVTVRDIILVNAAGDVVHDWGCGSNEACPSSAHFDVIGFHIRRAIHERLGSVVLHTHMPTATTMSVMRTENGGLVFPIHQASCRFHDNVVYDEKFSGLACGPEEGYAEGNRVADVLTGGGATSRVRAVFLRNHGPMIVGRNVWEALDDLYYLHRACLFQAEALKTAGGDMSRLAPLKDDIALATSRQSDHVRSLKGWKHISSHRTRLLKAIPSIADVC